MDLAFLNTLSDAQRAALAVLAEDLQNFGVTDSLSENAIGLQNMIKAAAAPAPASTSQAAQAKQPSFAPSKPSITKPSGPSLLEEVKAKQAASQSKAMPEATKKHSAKPFTLADNLKVIEGTLPFTVVLAATDGQNLWTPAEQTLWNNMMRAIGKADQQPTFMVLVGEASNDIQLASNHEATLREEVMKQLKDQPVLVMGHRALQLLTDGQGNAAAVRRGECKLEKIQEKGCFFTLVATYHGNTLLRQPFLKRQTWADLLAFKQMLDAGSE